MTDEERQKLVAFIVDLRALEHDDKADLLERMADEIERLADENRKLKINLDYAWRRIEAAREALKETLKRPMKSSG